MNTLDSRILDLLGNNLGKEFSIREITKKINDKYGSAFYPNIYNSITTLKSMKLLNSKKTGKATMIGINYSNPLASDFLAEIELSKKTNYFSPKERFSRLIQDLTNSIQQKENLLTSLLLISPEINFKLNRIELLAIIKDSKQDLIEEIFTITTNFESKNNMKLDCLILKESDFIKMLSSNEFTPAKKMISDKIILLGAQEFWRILMKTLNSNTLLETNDKNYSLSNISDKEIEFNLSRFGYDEFGFSESNQSSLAIEMLITSTLLGKDARKKEASAIIFLKNFNKINFSLLLFLFKMQEKLSDLLGLFMAIKQAKPSTQIDELINLMKQLHIKEKELDYSSLKKKLVLYNVL